MPVRVHCACMPCIFLHLPCPYLCASSVCVWLPCFLCLHRFESSVSCVWSARWVYTGAPAHVGTCVPVLCEIQQTLVADTLIQPRSCGALMSRGYVVGVACSPEMWTPPRAQREGDTLPTDRALHVPNSGRTPLTAIAHFPFATVTHLSSNGCPMCDKTISLI